MTLMDFSLYSPVIVAALAVFIVIVVKLFRLKKVSAKWLIGASITYGIVGFGLSFAFLIFEMNWYERTTGYGAGNAPLFWMIFYGPLSVALGQLIALIHWLFKKQPNNRLQSDAASPRA